VETTTVPLIVIAPVPDKQATGDSILGTLQSQIEKAIKSKENWELKDHIRELEKQRNKMLGVINDHTGITEATLRNSEILHWITVI